jgi:uncharacterized protein (TIGR02145 family)
MKKLALLFVFAQSLVFAQGEQRYADGTATDQDGNTFEWISYGYGENSFHWAIENADVVTYNDGTPIPQVLYPTEWANLTSGAWCYHNNDPSQERLYNWYAVNNPKFAPEGWRVASKDDFYLLEDYLSINGYNYDGTTGGNKIAKAMASTTGWDSSTTAGAPGNDQNLNNSSGFNASPKGYRASSGGFSNMGSTTIFWTFTQRNIDNAWYRKLSYDKSYIYDETYETNGYSVRFVRDAPNDTEPPVFTLIGPNPITVNQWTTYNDPGAQAYDNVDGDLTSSIVVSGTVDTSTPGTYYINYNVTDSAGNAANQATRTVVVVETTPTVYAGTDQAICEDETVTLGEATASNVSSVIWTTYGDGTFDNPSIINPTYIPGPQDRIIESFSLTLNAQGSNGQVFSDSAMIYITSLPTVSAGTNFEINEGVTFQLSEATASNESSVIWTTIGTGSFSDSERINPVYTPSQNDIHTGYVDLIITAHPIAPCTTSALDTVRITINPNPTVDAGPDLSVCQWESISITGASASNFSSLLWEVVSGTGTLIDASALTTTYTPSPNDIANGIVTLRLTTAYGTNNQQVSDEIQIVIEPCNTDILLNGTVSAENNQIKNVADPSEAQDAATKAYADAIVASRGLMNFSDWDNYSVWNDNTTVNLTPNSFVFLNADNTTLVLPDNPENCCFGDVIYVYVMRNAYSLRPTTLKSNNLVIRDRNGNQAFPGSISGIFQGGGGLQMIVNVGDYWMAGSFQKIDD